MSATIDTDTRTPGSVPRILQVGSAWGWRFLVVVAAILTTGWLLVQLRVVIIPVFVALILAALLQPLVNLLDRWVPRLLAVWLVLLTVVAGLTMLVYLLQAPVRDAIDELSASWGTARADIEDWLQTGPLGLSESQVDRVVERADDARRQFTSGLFSSAADSARMAAEVVGGIFLTIVLTFFFTKDGSSMWQWGLDRLHPVRRSTLDRSGTAAFGALQGWIRGVAITGAVDGLLIGVALLVLGVEAALPLAVITFFAAFFPIVGATVAGALAAAVALATEGPQTAIIVAIVVLVVQQVEGDVLLPVVMYRQVALHPVVVLLVLAIGGAIGGILGAIVSVPLTAAFTAAVAAARRDPEGAGRAGGGADGGDGDGDGGDGPDADDRQPATAS